MTPPKRSADDTRDRILAATRQLFASKGFDRTTIRAIAAEAGCDPALVIRYFGSKRDLFTAAVQSPLETFPDAHSGERADLVSVAEALLENWHTDRTFFGLLRAAASDDRAADLMRQFFENKVRPHQSRVTGLPPDQAALFGSMLVGIAFAREVTKIPPIANMTSGELAGMLGDVMASCQVTRTTGNARSADVRS